MRAMLFNKKRKIALVAPAGSFDREIFEHATKKLEEQGIESCHTDRIFHHWRGFSAQDWERALDLAEHFSDPGVQILWCVRGGYGSSRVLPFLDLKRLADSGKTLMGYSDITFLHNALLEAGAEITLHGPNFLEISSMQNEDVNRLFSFLDGSRPFRWKLSGKNTVRSGLATGRLLGGNLACVCHLLGTPYLSLKTFEGAILFLEDKNEAGYRIDRMLNHLKMAGVFDVIKGLVLGTFWDCEPYDEIIQKVVDVTSDYNFPIICLLPFGHGIKQDLLPLGGSALVDTDSGLFEVSL